LQKGAGGEQQRGDEQDQAEAAEAGSRRCLPLGQKQAAKSERHEADGHVDQEDRTPGEPGHVRMGQQFAEQRAANGRQAGGGAVGGQGGGALASRT
jgi:hypothetical protein